MLSLFRLRRATKRAERALDRLGRERSAYGDAQRAVDALGAHIQAIHTQRLQVIAQTQKAVQSLERLERLRIADKSFTVYQRDEAIDQAVGPGAGRHNPDEGDEDGPAIPVEPPGEPKGPSTPMHIHLGEDGRRSLIGYMDERYQANRDEPWTDSA